MRPYYPTLFLLLFSISLIAQNVVSPFQSGFYAPGNLGVRDLSYPMKSGLIFSDYNIFINSDKFKNIDGDEINGFGPIPFHIDVSGYINNLMLTYASEKISFLGNARYMAILAPSFSTISINSALGRLKHKKEITGGSSGFGDLAVAPVYLSWEFDKLDFTAGYMFVTPTGRYKTGADNNVGLGYWSHLLQAALFYYPLPQKATAITIMPTYEFHGKIKDVIVTPGGRFSLDYGVSQYFSRRFDVTLQGGHTWQVGEDSGNDVYWDKSLKDKSNMISVGAGYWLLSEILYVNLKWATTYGEHQNFSINSYVGQVVFAPSFKNKSTINN